MLKERKIKMANPSNDPRIQELLQLLIESDPTHPPFINSPFAKTGRKPGTNPHVGVDVLLRNQNEVNNGHPYLLSPFDGQIIEFQPKLGRIVVKGKDPVTGELRLVELLHSQTQLFDPDHLPADVKRGQRIGTMGGVGAGGRVHLHVQSFQAGDAGRTPLNPLKSLFEYLHPGEPVPALDAFTPPQIYRDSTPSLRPSGSNGRDQPSSAVSPGRMQPAIAPTHNMPGGFPENGAPPISYLDDANQTGTFDPAASGVPLPRPRPPQEPASWPDSRVAPLQQMPQTEPAAPWHPDWHDANDWPHPTLPNWAQMQPPTENTFPASNGVRGMTGGQPLAPQGVVPKPALTVQNLTAHALRMKGVPEADIGAAINDPAKMQNLLNQVYDRRSMIAPSDGDGVFGNQLGVATSAGQPSTPAAATLDDYIPFGWAGLPPLFR
jgi:hypothetical protein